METSEKICIGSDFPDEFSRSNYTIGLFGIPVYDEQGNIKRYNIFSSRMLVRHDADGKLYLYDFIRIKKETSNPHEQ